MTVKEALNYCYLRAQGAGLFARDKQEALRWYTAWEKLRMADEAGYGQWPIEALLQ